MEERRNKDKIGEFQGQWRFLSNFWPCGIVYDGEAYSSVEHAYQAAKIPLLQKELREEIKKTVSPGEAKKLSRQLPMREDWEVVKMDIMLCLLRQKFSNEPLRSKLLATMPLELVEGNWWGDIFWGVYQGRGLNNLGKLLMQIRNEL